MTARRLCRPLLVVLTTTLAAPACYTLIKHPRVNTAVYEDVQENRCTSCHYEDEVWGFHHPPEQGIYPPEHYGDWAFYYTVPWWYDSYWYFVPSEPGIGPQHVRDLRPGVEKGPIDGATGGPIGPPPDFKSTGGSVRAKDPDDNGKAKTDEKSDERTVRPKSDKGKDEAKQKDGGKGKKGS